jgi:hypothetical protein
MERSSDTKAPVEAEEGTLRRKKTHNHRTMAKVIWVGTIEVSYSDQENPSKRENAFTVVTTWADSMEEFRQKCEMMVGNYGWKLLGVAEANPVLENAEYSERVTDQLERTRVNPNAIIYGTFFTYPTM